MTRQIEAIYGVLRPLQPVDLPESEYLTVTITTSGKGVSTRDWAVVEEARGATAELKKIPTIEEVRAALP